MTDNSIRILQAAEAYKKERTIRDALIGRLRNLESERLRVENELNASNKALGTMRDALISVAADAVPPPPAQVIAS